jgi:hypothetical protein
MLVALFNAVKVESVPLNSTFLDLWEHFAVTHQAGHWVGKLRPCLRIGMACWAHIVIGCSPPATVPQAGTLQVSGTGTTKTIPCNGGYLSVSGRTNTITATGHCTSVSVAGQGNHVTIDSTDAISASGTGNVVTYHWGSPKIANAGASNTVQQG